MPSTLPARLAGALGIGVLALAPAVCSAQSLPAQAVNVPAGHGAAPAAKLVPVRLVGGATGNGPLDLAIDKGIFARHGVDVQVIHFVGGYPMATLAAASGQVDMGEYGTPILIGIASGIRIKIVGSPPVKTSPFDLVARKGIESVEDLRGKVIASGTLGAGGHQALIKILHESGLGENDVQLVPSGGAAAEVLLASGRFDAVIASGLTRLKMVDEGRANLIARAKDYFGRYQHSYVYATEGFINSHPETVRNYFLAAREAYEYSRDHLDELIDYTASRVKVRKELIRTYYQDQIAEWDLSFGVDLEGAANAVRILQELKEIKPNVNFDPGTWLDLRFIGHDGTGRVAATELRQR